MTGALTVMESGEVGAAEERQLVSALRHGVDVMCAITNDFLDIHALSVGRLKLSLAWTLVRELLLA